MKTIILAADREHPDESVIRQAGEILKSGGLVAFPTETVYGLGGDGLNAESSEKIYAAKGRPSDNPLIIHIADMESLNRIVSEIPEKARKMAEKFWPGPLTMIFKKSDAVPYETTGGFDSVAVRMPFHPVALSLIRLGGGYIAAPSANISGRPSPTRAAHVAEDLTGRVDMILVPDLESFKQQVRAWTINRNKECAKVNWRFKTQDARIQLARLYPVSNNSLRF